MGNLLSIWGVFATAWAAWWLNQKGWRGSFFAASSVLAVIWFYVYFFVRNRPEDVGLVIQDDDEENVEHVSEASDDQSSTSMFAPGVLHTVLLVGCFYFFVKFVRYALWSWAPFLLDTQFGLDSDTAGYMSTLFDLFGFLGAIPPVFYPTDYLEDEEL